MKKPLLRDHDSMVIRIISDSGEAIQLAGEQLTNASSALNSDMSATLDFCAESRLLASTLPGVIGF